MLDELHEEKRKSSKLLEENTQAKPHLFPKTGQSGKEERWNGPRGASGGVKSWKWKRILVGAVPDALGPSIECGP